jgi:uncharacterized protein
MNKLQIILNSLILSMSILHVSALQAKPVEDKTVDRLLLLSNMEEILKANKKEMKLVFDDQAKTMVKQALYTDTLNIKQQDAANQIATLMVKMTNEILEDPKYYEMIKKSYKSALTEEEALANIAFLETPYGQSISKKNIKIIGEIMSQAQTLTKQTLENPDKKAQFIKDLHQIIQPLIDEKNKSLN